MIQKQDLIYPELSYKLVGLAYNVHNELGHGHLEKIYQKAYAKELKEANIEYKEQAPYKVIYKEEIIGNNYLDFLIEGKVIIELKRSDFHSKKYIDQISNYIKVSNLQLAILINFTSTGVRIKRIVNELK